MIDQAIGFGTIPWWIWNGQMNCAEMARQLHLMKDAGLEGWTLWARFGLELEYLSHDFMRRVRFAVEKSAQLGLDVWIYDEYAWPSGSARGQVREVDPDYRMRGLSCFTHDVEGGKPILYDPPWGSDGRCLADPGIAAGCESAIAGDARPFISPYLYSETNEAGNRIVFDPRIERVLAMPLVHGQMRIDEAVDVTDRNLHRGDVFRGGGHIRVACDLPRGDWRLLVLISRDFGAQVDVLNPRAVRCFIERTHERYKAYVGDYFGSTIKGFFSDETRMIRATQHRFTEPTTPWSSEMFARLAAKGVDRLDACLAAVFCEEDSSDLRTHRLRFWTTLSELYRESFYEPLCQWAHEHKLIYTGDCFSEDSLIANSLGDYFAIMRNYHMPGLDALGLPNHQSPMHFKSPKFPSSVAHQRTGAGAGRCLSEGPGLLGWGATMEEMRRVTDWMYVFGVNKLMPNALHYTLRHEQLYETPSYFFQWTLWPFYGEWDRYTRNLGQALTRGRHVAPVALFYPTQAILASLKPLRPARGEGLTPGHPIEQVHRAAVDTAVHLLRAQLDFDYLDRDAIHAATCEGSELTLNGERFQIVVAPGHIVIDRRAAGTLRQYVEGGGHVVWVTPLPEQYDDGGDAAALRHWIDGCGGCTVVDSEQAVFPEALDHAVRNRVDLPIQLASSARENFAIHLRRGDAGYGLFIVYFGEEPAVAELELRQCREVAAVDVARPEHRGRLPLQDGRLVLRFEPYESKMIEWDVPDAPADTHAPRNVNASPGGAMGDDDAAKMIDLDPAWRVRLTDDNLFVAEPLAVTTRWHERRAWEAWIHYEQRFTVEIGEVPSRLLWLMDDVQDLQEQECLTVMVNGRPARIGPSPIIDPGLLAADLAPLVRTGRNEIVLRVAHSDYLNARDLFRKRRSPAPVVRPRVFGNFLVEHTRITAMPENIPVRGGDDLCGHGLALYSGRAIYHATFSLDAASCLTGVTFTDLAHHAVVRVDGRELGKVLWRPWRIGCHAMLQEGPHQIEIEVVNTQANQMFEEPRPWGLSGNVRLMFHEAPAPSAALRKGDPCTNG